MKTKDPRNKLLAIALKKGYGILIEGESVRLYSLFEKDRQFNSIHRAIKYLQNSPRT